MRELPDYKCGWRTCIHGMGLAGRDTCTPALFHEDVDPMNENCLYYEEDDYEDTHEPKE